MTTVWVFERRINWLGNPQYNILEDLEVEDNLSEWHQQILKCWYIWLVAKYHTSVYSYLFTFQALALTVGHDGLMLCLETCPHLQTLYVPCFPFPMRNKKHQIFVCRVLANKDKIQMKLVCKLFPNPVCRLYL